jgi:sulfite oxidase
LEDLKKLPRVEASATLQGSGNCQSGFNKFDRTSGTTWSQDAVSTTKWGGIRLQDLMKHTGLGDKLKAEEIGNMHHIQFGGLDGLMASIGIKKAMNPYNDVIVAYELSDELIPRDHGYPLCVIVP